MDIDEDRLQEFMGLFMSDMGGATTVLMVSLGDELGFYDVLASGDPMGQLSSPRQRAAMPA